MRRVTGRQAWSGQPGRCPARQQPRYQPAPSQACPALGRPEPNTPSVCLWPAPGEKSQGGPGSGPLGGSVRAVASPRPPVSSGPHPARLQKEAFRLRSSGIKGQSPFFFHKGRLSGIPQCVQTLGGGLLG